MPSLLSGLYKTIKQFICHNAKSFVCNKGAFPLMRFSSIAAVVRFVSIDAVSWTAQFARAAFRIACGAIFFHRNKAFAINEKLMHVPAIWVIWQKVLRFLKILFVILINVVQARRIARKQSTFSKRRQ